MSPTSPTSRSMMRRVLLWSLAGHACLLGASLRHNFVWGDREILGVPLHVLLGIGEALGLLLFALLAGIPYARAALRQDELEARQVWRGGILLLVAATLVPPFLSSDIYDYLARGRVESHYGGNPYSDPPARWSEDPVFEKAQWTETGNPYGPISTLLQVGVAGVAGDNVWLGLYLFKVLSAVSHLLTAWLVGRAIACVAPERATWGVFLWLWNPWILLESAGSGHNDAWMAAFLAAAVCGMARQRIALGTLCFGLAVLTKHGCALVGPLLLALCWRRRQLGAFALGVAGSGLVAAPMVWHYLLEPGALDAILHNTGVQRTSLQYVLTTILGESSSTALTRIGMAIACVFMLASIRRVRDLDSYGRAAVCSLTLFVLVAMPMFSPWYHLWYLPLLGAWAWVGWARVFGWVAVLGPCSYLVFAATRSLDTVHQVWQWGVGLVPVALLILFARRSDGVKTPP